MLGGEYRVRVVRDRSVKSVSVEKGGTKLKGSSFELKRGESAEVVIKIPA